MTSAIDVLRRMLDERGVEWDYGISGATTTRFSVNGIDLTYTPMRDGLVCSTILTPARVIAATLGPKVTGNTSDGYHTFNELYHHRAVLFSVIVRDHRELAWKSMRHHDGTMYDGMFIVGIETPEGQATYHYDIDPYWDMFNCKELDQAPEWDGHTPSEAIERIATLGSCNCSNDCTNSERIGTCYDTGESRIFHCSKCGLGLDDVFIDDEERYPFADFPQFCPFFGAKVVEPTKNDVDVEVDS